MAAGAGIGVAGAVLAAPLLAPLLFRTSAYDPTVFPSVAVVLAIVSIAATWAPAVRAGRVDPSIVLRSE